MALFLAGHVALVGTLYLVQVDLWEKLLLATDSHDLTIDAAEGPVTAHAQMLKEASPAPWLGRYFGDLLTMVPWLLTTYWLGWSSKYEENLVIPSFCWRFQGFPVFENQISF